MALQIIDKDSVFNIYGPINTSNVRSLDFHLNHLLSNYDSITVNIECVTEIDACGVKVFGSLFNSARSQKKEFNIIGRGCKELIAELRTVERY